MARGQPWRRRPARAHAPLWPSAAWLVPACFLLVGWQLYDDLGEQVVFGLPVVVGALTTLRLKRRQASAHQQLLTSERRTQGLSDSMDALVWESDALGRITHAGPQVVDHFGLTVEEVIGMSLADLVHPQELERLGALITLGESWSDERFRCLHRDGSERWYVGSGSPIRDDTGAVVGLVGTSRPLGRDGQDELRRTLLAQDVYDVIGSRKLQPVFQPILSVSSGMLIGVEALSRFPGSERNPEQWFRAAADVGLAVELELLALELGLVRAGALPEDIYISFNVSPTTLTRPALLNLIAQAAIDTHRVVLEVTEHASIVDYEAVLGALFAYRAMGVRLAVDDAGAGYASFRHILQMAPEFIKLDRSLVSGIDVDPAKRALAAAVVAFATEMGAVIVAEGIETGAEYRAARQLGIHAAQGYLFGRPTADWATWVEWHANGPLLAGRHR